MFILLYFLPFSYHNFDRELASVPDQFRDDSSARFALEAEVGSLEIQVYILLVVVLF